MDRVCNECGSTDWREIEGLEVSYPDRRQERNRTVRRVFVCESCDSEGRRFEDGQDGAITYSGALR